jgi:hypothetical protein
LAIAVSPGHHRESDDRSQLNPVCKHFAQLRLPMCVGTTRWDWDGNTQGYRLGSD